MKPLKIGIVVLAALLPATPAMAQVYRWVDKEGKVHFSDTPPNEDAKVTQQRTPGGGGADESQLPYGLQMAMKNHPVTLYVGNNCGEFCSNGRALLAKRGVPYRERNAEVNRGDAEALNSLAGSLTVPTLQVGTQALAGFTEDAWNSALDAAGYPRTKLPGLKLPSPTPPPPPPAPPKTPPTETKAPQ
jgi:glutaredoxin